MSAETVASITVLGSGSWGCTLAGMLARGGHHVRLWGHRADELDGVRANGHPPGVPELTLPADLEMTTDLAAATSGARAVIVVVASQAIGSVAERLAALPHAPPIVILASKGIDVATLRPLGDVIAGHLPASRVVAVSGPCIAREVAQGIPTSVVAACEDPAVARLVQGWLSTPTFRVYWHNDLLGVELGGALKNVIAIAAGVGDGLGFGANSKSALLARGLAEMRRLAVAMGANDLTITGMAGLGDLCVTCFSPYSRNRRFGEAIGRGESPAAVIAAMGEVVEGVSTAEAAVQLAARHGVEVPIAEAVTQLVAGKWTPIEAVERLMTRELKAEFP